MTASQIREKLSNFYFKFSRKQMVALSEIIADSSTDSSEDESSAILSIADFTQDIAIIKDLKIGDRVIYGNKLYVCSSKTEERITLVYTDNEEMLTEVFEVNSDTGEFERQWPREYAVDKAFSLEVFINGDREVGEPADEDDEEEEYEEEEPQPLQPPFLTGPMHNYIVENMPPALYHLWANGIQIKFQITSDHSSDVELYVYTNKNAADHVVSTTVSYGIDDETGDTIISAGECIVIDHYPDDNTETVRKYGPELENLICPAFRYFIESMPFEILYGIWN